MSTFSAKDGRQIEIRPAAIEDAERIIRFAKILFPSTDQVLTLPEEYKMTVEQEVLFIESYTNNPTALLLVPVYGNEVVSLLNFLSVARRKRFSIRVNLALVCIPRFRVWE